MAKRKLTGELLMSGLGILVLALVFLLVHNQYGNLKEARAMVAGEQEALAKIRAHLVELERLKEQAPVLERQLAMFERQMPSEPNEDMVIKSIRDYADITGSQMIRISFKQRVNKEGYTEMPLDMVFEGHYHELLQLLNYLQSGQRASRIETLRIAQGGQDMSVLRADISATTFYAPR